MPSFPPTSPAACGAMTRCTASRSAVPSPAPWSARSPTSAATELRPARYTGRPVPGGPDGAVPDQHRRGPGGASAVPGRRHRGAGRRARRPCQRSVPPAERPSAGRGVGTRATRSTRRRSTWRRSPTSRGCRCSAARRIGWSTSFGEHQNGDRKMTWQTAVPVIPEEEPSPFVAVASVADAASMVTNWGSNGVEHINTDIALTLARLPVSREIGLAALDRVGSDGIAIRRGRRLRPAGTPRQRDGRLARERQADRRLRGARLRRRPPGGRSLSRERSLGLRASNLSESFPGWSAGRARLTLNQD